MDRPTRQELEYENEHLRSKLEMAQTIISEALGYEEMEEASEDDVDDNEGDLEEDE